MSAEGDELHPAYPYLRTSLPGPQAQELVERDREVLSPSYTRDYPLVAESGKGMWVTDPDGNRIEIMEMAPNCVQYEALAALRAGKPATALVAPLNPRQTAKA